MPSTWKECMDEGKVRTASIDKGMSLSLIEMSDNRMDFLESQKISDRNASIIMSEYYEAMREVCEALITLKGFRCYSHECITFFIKEILEQEEIAIIFDRYRKVRNKINYYGKKVKPDFALQGKEDIKNIISELKKIIETIH